jgi:dihydroxy-acid dehydratase
VRLIARPMPPAALVTPESVENAMRVLLALGGSTNAVVHLAAIAGRAGLPFDLARLDALSRPRRCWST